MEDEDFTAFMIRCMAEQEGIRQAFLIMRREDGRIMYRSFRQQFADTIGMLRVTALSVENDMVKDWEKE